MPHKRLDEIRRTASYQQLSDKQRVAVDELYEEAKSLDGDSSSLSERDLDTLDRRINSTSAPATTTSSRQEVIGALRREILPAPILETQSPPGVRNPILAMVRSKYPVRGLYDSDEYDGRIVLTFDDGPSPGNTAAILDELARQDVKATFFVNGVRVNRSQEHRDLIRRIVNDRHELGHHGWDHTDFRELTGGELIAQFERTQEAVNQALGYEHPLKSVRPPYAGLNSDSIRAIADAGLNLVLWDLDSKDWRHRDGDQIASRVLESNRSLLAQNGGVVLMHDTKAQTSRALRTVLEAVRQRASGSGEPFSFQTVSEALDEKYSTDRSIGPSS